MSALGMVLPVIEAWENLLGVLLRLIEIWERQWPNLEPWFGI